MNGLPPTSSIIVGSETPLIQYLIQNLASPNIQYIQKGGNKAYICITSASSLPTYSFLAHYDDLVVVVVAVRFQHGSLPLGPNLPGFL